MTEFLNPGRKLVDEVVDWLCGRVERDPSGARSLAHLMVVVPTAQSGRNLRLALAKKAAEKGWGGILPPHVVQPFHLVRPADQSLPEANEAEVAAMFMRFLSEKRSVALTAWPHLFQRAEGTMDLQAVVDPDAGFALLDQMSDIWRVLSGKGLLMQDVPKSDAATRVLESALGEDRARWDELASFEEEFFAFLKAHGVRLQVESIALAKKSAAPLDPEIREIVLPALADPVLVLHDVLAQYADHVKITTLLHCAKSDSDRFDEWGCPKVECWTGAAHPIVSGLVDDDIVSLPDDNMLAERLVKDFPAQGSGLKLPTLGLCDSGLFTVISAAFLNEGYTIQNPERNRLAVSSLGMILRDLLALWRPPDAGVPWTSFAALMRSDDVLAALKSAGLASSRSRVLEGLDGYQNACLPTFVEGRFELPKVELHEHENKVVAAFVDCGNGFLSWMEEARKGRSLVDFLREMLGRIFLAKSLDAVHSDKSDKEFAQAVDCVRNALAMLSSESIGKLGLSDAKWIALARRLFGAASYSLESDEKDVVRTEGWLELVWSLGDKIALAGLHEGSVPDSVVGHAFLPNELRAALGLTSNETRLARDSWLLQELVVSHAPHAVRAYVARTNAKGDICRPSRLLFLCSDDALASRVKGLFDDAGETAPTPPRTVSKAWRLRLPDEVPLKEKDGREYLSPSAIDTYLKSPVEYFLKYGLGMGDRYKEKKELGFDDYGTFVHLVLERFANGQKTDPLTDEASIAEALKAIIDEEVKRFGTHPTVNVLLQLKSVRERIMRFAAIQTQWAQDGWRVEGTEMPYFAKPFGELDVWIKGFVDRVDYRVLPDGSKEFRIIDYKTWDEFESAKRKHVRTGAAKQIDFAGRLKLPTQLERNKPVRMLTVQLPLYGACLKAESPERFDGPITGYDYLVLAEDKVDVLSVKEYVDLSLRTARVAIERIKDNVFWPARADENGKLYDFGRIFSFSPEKDWGSGDDASDWLKKQEAKLKELENA
jgi:RecB family exonuclease